MSKVATTEVPASDRARTDSQPLTMRVLASDLHLPEGPLELPGGDLLVCEVGRDRLTRVSADDMSESTFSLTSPGPNGAALGPDGAVYVATNGGYEWGRRPMADGSVWERAPVRKLPVNGGIERIAADGSQRQVLYSECDGRPLIAPNDLVFDSHGGFYFTDFGRSEGRTRELGGLFYAAADGSFIRESYFPLEMGNGVALSPDERTVYAAETTTGRVLAFRVRAPGELEPPTLVATMPGAAPTFLAMCDSMCVDGPGRILQATIANGGITVIDPATRVSTHYSTGDPTTTNCCFGGPDLRTLYITLGRSDRLVAVEDWMCVGHRLVHQAPFTTAKD